jgi:serine protease inhibitor
MRRLGVATLTCAGVLAAAGCGSTAATGDAAAHLEASDVALAPARQGIAYDGLATGIRRLGHDLTERITHTNGNVVFSPTSLAVAFAMLRDGAAGDTARQLDRVLQLPARRHPAYNGLIHTLRHPGAGDVLQLNNGLFVDPSLSVRRPYLVGLKRWYGAGVEQVDFPGKALAEINGWVDHNTHGRIPRLLDQLDPEATLALVNTVYLNAKWQTPFDPTRTARGPFTTAGGSSVTARIMHRTGGMQYADGTGWQAVRLPYGGGHLSMWVLLPGGNGDPARLLTARALHAAASGFGTRNVDLSLPRWDTSTRADLIDPLTRLGLTKVFGGAGDFSRLTPSPLSIGQVVQQANITVGEKGTEAAAATAIVGETSAPLAPPDVVAFNVEHPFAFAVTDDRSGVPLFEGVVGDPS